MDKSKEYDEYDDDDFIGLLYGNKCEGSEKVYVCKLVIVEIYVFKVLDLKGKNWWFISF